MDWMYQDQPYTFFRYSRPMSGDVFVNDSGNVVKRISQGIYGVTRMILKPKEVFHTFAGIVFKEVAKRPAQPEEWVLAGDMTVYNQPRSGPSRVDRIILVPIRFA